MEAKWGIFGNAAGFVRNNAMADRGGVLLLIWDGKSAGSKQMKAAALQRNLIVIEIVTVVEDIEYVENPDVRLATAIKKRIDLCGGYCPCVPQRDQDHMCKCLKFRTTGECCCNLYIKKTW